MAAALLAFDSSTETMSIAVECEAGTRLWNGPGGAQASATLVPQLHHLLADLGLAFAQLDGIAFGCGPGAFTGLRAACAVAQGLAVGTGVPLWPVDSLQIVAEDVRQRVAPSSGGLEVGVVMDARMGELYAARYRWDGQAWTPIDAPLLCDPDGLIDRWRACPPAVLAGSGVDAIGHGLEALATFGDVVDRAAALLSLARRMHGTGRGVDAAEALPTYLRDKVALTTAERLARQGVAEAAR